MNRNYVPTEEEKARVHELLKTILIDPQAFRFALGLETDEDIKEEQAKQEAFSEWRARAIGKLRERGNQ